jgi:hypothetical protein
MVTTESAWRFTSCSLFEYLSAHMKYIYSTDNGIHLDRYFDYLSSIPDELRNIIGSATSECRFSLTDPRSFHDSWLQSAATWYEPAVQADGSRVLAKIELLGPQHDRVFVFEYGQVERMSFSHDFRKYGDLLCYELYVEDGQFCHNFEFDFGRTIEVKCGAFKFAETLLEPS